MKKTLLAIALAAATTTAFADTTLSGHVNYTIKDVSDLEGSDPGDNQDWRVDDQTTSPSRFRIISSKKAGAVTWGTRFEFGVNSADATDDVTTRNAFVFAKGSFGKVGLGQQSEVGDGYAERDFSGTYVLNGNNGIFRAGADVIDGGRTENLRYDSPKLGPATISLSYQEENINVGLDVKTKNIRFSVFSQSNEADSGDHFGGSLAAKFGIFTAAIQAGVQENGDDDDQDVMAILGIKSGAYSVAVDFGETDNGDGAEEIEHVGLSFVYRPAKGVELYAGARNVEQGDFDETGIALGSRVKF